ncbi:hypothetical protein RvY_13885 [Ramazzottius varieornatus]|uniref:Uncharacterized protein n=1 Tax=Ramazzottius varieornatus TaxID=947166 RepID=A0A1D1VRJ4_RAMVA|nr:hypothetical protein RvY_13885 [Ramazzottius varieornatus]
MTVRPLPVETPQPGLPKTRAAPQQQRRQEASQGPQGKGTPEEKPPWVNQPSHQQQRQEALLQQQPAQGSLLQSGSQGVEIFRDDLDGAKMDPDKWIAADVASTVNPEMEYYAADNVIIKDGTMMLTRGLRQSVHSNLLTNPTER